MSLFELPQPQAKTTVFKIETQEWNNVPKCVFDATLTLINQFDAHLVLFGKQTKETRAEITNLRTKVDNVEK